MLTAISIALILSSQCGKSKTNFFLFGFSPYFQARGLLEFLDHHIHTKFGIKSTLIFIIRLEQRHDNFNQNFITPISIVVLFRNFWLRSRQFIDDLTLVGDAATYHEHMDSILEGLPKDFDSVIAFTKSRLPHISIEEEEGLMLVQEV